MEEYKYPFGSYKKNLDRFLEGIGDEKMFYCRLRPEDCLCGCSKNTFYRRLNEEMPEWFLMACCDFKKDEDSDCSYEPVFTGIQQAAWDAALKDYVKNKAAFCAKWGCE